MLGLKAAGDVPSMGPCISSQEICVIVPVEQMRKWRPLVSGRVAPEPGLWQILGPLLQPRLRLHPEQWEPLGDPGGGLFLRGTVCRGSTQEEAGHQMTSEATCALCDFGEVTSLLWNDSVSPHVRQGSCSLMCLLTLVFDNSAMSVRWGRSRGSQAFW